MKALLLATLFLVGCAAGVERLPYSDEPVDVSDCHPVAACGEGGVAYQCKSTGMIAWPEDNMGRRDPTCVRTDTDERGERPTYCCN